MTARFTRRLQLAATLVLILAPAVAVRGQQAAPAAAPVFEQLLQLQDANLGIARQMAETQQRAAADLQQAIADGTIAKPLHQQVARTFVANALTLAAVMLSPVQTRPFAPGQSLQVLIQRNIAMLQSIAPLAAQDRGFSGAIARYTVLQMQTQDLAGALQNGWRRYADILVAAQSSGVLTAQAFDSVSQTWGLETPSLSTDVAALPAPSAPEPTPTPASEAATPQPTAVPEPTAIEPVPEPALTGTPHSAGQEGDLAASVTPLQVPEIGEKPAPEAPERLPSGGPLEIAAAAPPSGPIGDWMVTTDDSGTTVTAANRNGDTAGVIKGLRLRCAPDGAIEYVIDATEDFTAFRVYSDRSQYRTVRAEGNVITADNTAAMTNTLRLATEWSRQVADAGRPLTIRAEDGSGTLALFSTNGFLEARDKLAEYCAGPKQPLPMTPPPETPIAAASPSPETPAAPEAQPPAVEAPALAEVPAAEPTAAPQAAAAPTPPKRDTRPPIPRPRLERPVDIMSGG